MRTRCSCAQLDAAQLLSVFCSQLLPAAPLSGGTIGVLRNLFLVVSRYGNKPLHQGPWGHGFLGTGLRVPGDRALPHYWHPGLTSLCSQGLFLGDFTPNSHQARSDLSFKPTLCAVSPSPAVGFEAEQGPLSAPDPPAPPGSRSCDNSPGWGRQEGV